LHKALANILASSANQASELPELTQKVKLPTVPEVPNNQNAGSILLAEDNSTTGKLIDISLSSLGYRVTIVTDGQAVVDLVEQKSFDLLLMDCQMPIMDGYTAARHIREAGHRIPIIALTASSRQEDKDRCREAGMNDFVCKPFKHKLLHQVIAKWLTKTQNTSADSP
jgi:CheY-like chemotaxis protein